MQPINLTGKVDGKQAVQKLRTFEDALHRDLLKTITALTYDVELLVKQKLSGPVLKAPTGNLKGSINSQITETPGSIVGSVGTSVITIPYARIHEYGGTILPKNGPYLTFKTADGAWHRVKQVVMPERSYLRSSLADKRSLIEQQIRNSINRARSSAGLK